MTIGHHVTSLKSYRDRPGISFSQKFRFCGKMSMSKLLENGLEAQIINGITRDNNKVKFSHQYSPIHITRNALLSTVLFTSPAKSSSITLKYSPIHITRDLFEIQSYSHHSQPILDSLPQNLDAYDHIKGA